MSSGERRSGGMAGAGFGAIEDAPRGVRTGELLGGSAKIGPEPAAIWTRAESGLSPDLSPAAAGLSLASLSNVSCLAVCSAEATRAVSAVYEIGAVDSVGAAEGAGAAGAGGGARGAE